MKRIVQNTLPRSIELQWQNGVIERWLNTAGIPLDVRDELLAMQRELKEEIEKLGESRSFSC